MQRMNKIDARKHEHYNTFFNQSCELLLQYKAKTNYKSFELHLFVQIQFVAIANENKTLFLKTLIKAVGPKK